MVQHMVAWCTLKSTDIHTAVLLHLEVIPLQYGNLLPQQQIQQYKVT